MKKCSDCGEIKPKKEFYLQKDSRTKLGESLSAYCKPCLTVRNDEVRMKKKFGLDRKGYYEILKSQNGCCKICGTSDPGRGKTRFDIDHNHKTNKVRGLLCGECNRMLGVGRDNPELLMKGAVYLLEQGHYG